MSNPTLFKLSEFFPENDAIKKYMQFTKLRYCKGYYYLGGQIQMNINEEITKEKIDEIIKNHSGEYCASNTFEVQSIQENYDTFLEILKVIEEYNNRK
jgi:hypothetical protein